MRFRTGLAAITILAVGCGCSGKSAPSYGSEDGLQIAVLIETLNDAKNDRRRFGELFAEGTSFSPEQWRRFCTFYYEVIGKPEIQSDSAMANIKLRNELTGHEPTQQVWTFVREAQRWKIKTVALP